MRTKTVGYDVDKKRVVLEMFRHPDLREVMTRLHDKTGMVSSIDIIRLALKQLDANLPAAPKPQAADA
ncbi:hypothetical protein [Mesorhizobium sp. BR-1-1-10]|uniref:hypothetical protein n=1 Tax=Mesorhizobium sp. BR-1-1-10 TaxID=2876660 RepID=UPI001CD0CD55|nr:hypothetical protein [Mesorhizobium sp. BR-1-1-10]MBZ9975507.1 hypothetical protein [Mesorhizobium sp. BR-1-1-10]